MGNIQGGVAIEKKNCNYSSGFLSLAWSHILFASYQLYFPSAWEAQRVCMGKMTIYLICECCDNEPC